MIKVVTTVIFSGNVNGSLKTLALFSDGDSVNSFPLNKVLLDLQVGQFVSVIETLHSYVIDHKSYVAYENGDVDVIYGVV